MNSESLAYHLIYSHSIPVTETTSKKRKIGEAGDARSFLSSPSLSGTEFRLDLPDPWVNFLVTRPQDLGLSTWNFC